MAVEIEVDEFADGIALFRVKADGGFLSVVAEVVVDGRKVILRDLDIHGEGVWANDLGPAKLRRIVLDAMEQYDVDEILIEGSIRQTGAGPGRRPGHIRFSRKAAPVVLAEPK